MHIINTLSAIVFWLILALGYPVGYGFFKKAREEKSLQAMLKYFSFVALLTVAVIGASIWHWAMPAKEKAKAEFYGTPIVHRIQNLEGKVFTPLAFVVTEYRILLYDKDGKVYALDGIKLDGTVPEELTVASNISYTVYQKDGQLMFGKY